MSDAKKTNLNDNEARARSVHSPGNADELPCSQSVAQTSITQVSRSNRQSDGGKVIPVVSKKLPTLPSPQKASTPRIGKSHQSDDQHRCSSAYSQFHQEQELAGLADNVPSTATLNDGARDTDPHDTSRRRDAISHVKCASYKQAACMKMQDSNKKRKTYQKCQAPSAKLGRTALENQALNAYWEAAVSSAEKHIGKTSALVSKHQIHPRMQSTSLTHAPNFRQASNKASKSISGAPLHELSVLLCQPYPHPHLGMGRSHLAESSATLSPLLEKEPAKSNQKNQRRK